MRSFTSKMITGAVLGAVVFHAGPSMAAPTFDKCQAALEKATNDLRKATMDTLKLCADAIRKEQALNEFVPPKGKLAKAANTCQGKLAKVFDRNGLSGTTSIQKFNAAIDKAFTAPAAPNQTCNDTFLARLGHMVSGAINQAPGTNDWDFAKTYLAVQTVRSAENEMTAQVRDFVNVINAAKSAPAAIGTGVANAATDCTLPTNCDYKHTSGCRSDLCGLGIMCRTHSCTLSNSGPAPGASFSQVNLAASPLAPFALIGRSSFEICSLEGENYPIGDTGDGYLIVGGPSKQLGSVNLLGNTICVDTIAAEGYCSAGGTFNGHSKNLTLCQDRVTSDAGGIDECAGADTGVGAISEASCFCDLGGGLIGAACGAGVDCGTGTCGVTATGSKCFAGTKTGTVKLAGTGSTVSGDCVVLNSTAFTTLGSMAAFGADMTACTNDDVAAPAAVATTPFTSGTAQAHLLDAVSATGSCTTNVNTNCIEDANCGGSDTCDGTQSLVNDLATAVLVGAPLASVVNFETSNLSGLTLVGGFPAANSGTGDLVTAFKTTCQ